MLSLREWWNVLLFILSIEVVLFYYYMSPSIFYNNQNSKKSLWSIFLETVTKTTLVDTFMAYHHSIIMNQTMKTFVFSLQWIVIYYYDLPTKITIVKVIILCKFYNNKKQQKSHFKILFFRNCDHVDWHGNGKSSSLLFCLTKFFGVF